MLLRFDQLDKRLNEPGYQTEAEKRLSLLSSPDPALGISSIPPTKPIVSIGDRLEGKKELYQVDRFKGF